MIDVRCRGAVLIGLILIAACSTDPEVSADAALHPGVLFTGFDDGSADYKVPATLANVGDGTTVKWTVADPSLATVETEQPAPGAKASASLTHHAIVTTKKSGKTKLRATADGKTFEIPLTITQYAPGARDLGNDLYQENRTGMTTGESGTKALGCIGCHGARGTARHSPSEIGGFDDDQILKTIATAVKPDGSLANGGVHKFVLEKNEQEAILARLRSLEPVDFPK